MNLLHLPYITLGLFVHAAKFFGTFRFLAFDPFGKSTSTYSAASYCSIHRGRRRFRRGNWPFNHPPLQENC